MSFLMVGSLVSQSIEDSLLIYYSWDSTIVDQSGNDNNPIYFSAEFTEDRFGDSNKALYFNGEDGFIILPPYSNLQPPFPISFSCWFKLDDLVMEHSCIFTNDFTEAAHSGIWTNLNSDGRMQISYGDGNCDYSYYVRKTFATNETMNAQEWYFMVCVLTNSDSLSIFINGEQNEGTYNGYAYYMTYLGGLGNIGRKDASYSNSPYYFKGCLDEFRYWNRVLSDREIDRLYRSELVGFKENNSNDELIIYPNPTSSDVSLKNLDIEGEYIAIVIDMQGKIIFSAKNTENIDLSEVPEGMYFLKIETSKGKRYFRKIVKM